VIGGILHQAQAVTLTGKPRPEAIRSSCSVFTSNAWSSVCVAPVNG
jgi:hypothetical protein